MKFNPENTIDNAYLVDFKFIIDPRGDLVEIQHTRDLPFIPKRTFLISQVPNKNTRGEHAHKECHQLLIAVSGIVHVKVDDGFSSKEYILTSPKQGIYIPPMIWGAQYNYSKEAVLLVFASENYDPDDYIRKYEDYLKLRNE